jgi:acyl carrier protein phosphodiesterase
LNFLAHIFLSGNDEQLMIGNFIADFVKGNKKDNYPDQIRKGIELHRAIDDFTDHHPITDDSKARLRPKYRKYSGVIVDLYYDHFLASNFQLYSDVPLPEFAKRTYSILTDNQELLPDGVKQFLPYMIERDWLTNYATIEGIGRTLTGLSKRVSFENKMDESVHDLREDYGIFKNEFYQFFPQLITFAAGKKL